MKNMKNFRRGDAEILLIPLLFIIAMIMIIAAINDAAYERATTRAEIAEITEWIKQDSEVEKFVFKERFTEDNKLTYREYLKIKEFKDTADIRALNKINVIRSKFDLKDGEYVFFADPSVGYNSQTLRELANAADKMTSEQNKTGVEK